MITEVSFECLDLKLGKHAPFLITLTEGAENELHVIIAIANVGKVGEGLENIASTSNNDLFNTRLRNIFQESAPITPNDEYRYEVRFDNYIIYQVRNESFCSFDTEEIRIGKYLIVFEKSKLLEHLSSVTNACKLENETYYPGEWKHYGIYTQNCVIDVVSHCPPVVSEIICKD